MKVTFIDPLSRGWQRMTQALFKPFDIGKWFVVGFTAFLAGLMDGHGGSKFNRTITDDHSEFREIVKFPHTAWSWLMDHSGWAVLIFIGVLFIIGIVVVLTWLSSRGKFMFLDNVVHDKSQVSKPWYTFKDQGNSLFVWRLGFGLISFFVFILFIFQGFSLANDIYENSFSQNIPLITIAGIVLLGIVLILLISFIVMLLDSFIVPIMYKHGLSATQAWNKFLPLLSKHFIYFILFGLLLFAINIALIVAIMIFGFSTCCIGFILLVLPYISSVVLLPISYTLRAFSVEFLEQFGAAFSVFPVKKKKSKK
ncbi:MAG: hypothetical protein R6V04_06525 [bacterium]